MVRARVEGHGDDCTRASTAAEALSKLEPGPSGVDFSHTAMPGGMDGVELARTVRQRWPGTPIRLTTGSCGRARLGPAEFEVIYKP
jgi:CheY-like chemotaxis protein